MKMWLHTSGHAVDFVVTSHDKEWEKKIIIRLLFLGPMIFLEYHSDQLEQTS